MGKKTGRPRGRPKTRELSSTSVKLEKEADFAAELLSNHFKGRPKRRIVEDAVKAMADGVLRYGPGGRTAWLDLWDSDESVRALRLLTAEGYNLDADQAVTRRFVRAHWWLFYGDAACTSPRYGTAALLYPRLPLYVKQWREAGEIDIADVVAKDLRAAGLPVPKRNE